MICDDRPAPSDVGPGWHWHGQCGVCDAGAGLGRFGSPTSSVIQTSEYEQQSAAVSK
jgi:hypothetical protein